MVSVNGCSVLRHAYIPYLPRKEANNTHALDSNMLLRPRSKHGNMRAGDTEAALPNQPYEPPRVVMLVALKGNRLDVSEPTQVSCCLITHKAGISGHTYMLLLHPSSRCCSILGHLIPCIQPRLSARGVWRRAKIASSFVSLLTHGLPTSQDRLPACLSCLGVTVSSLRVEAGRGQPVRQPQ